MGRPKKLKVEVSRESYEYAEMIVQEFPKFREKCEIYEKSHKELLKQLRIDDAYNPDGFATEEIFFRGRIPNDRQQKAFDEYLDAKRKVFFVLHPVQYLIEDEQTRAVAEKVIVNREPVQYTTIYAKGKIISERTVAREKKRVIAIIADYIDSYIHWEVEQCFILKDNVWGCCRPQGWSAAS